MSGSRREEHNAGNIKESGLQSFDHLTEDGRGGNLYFLFSGNLCGQKSDHGPAGEKGSHRRNSDTPTGTAANRCRILSAPSVQPKAAAWNLFI